MDRRVFDVLVVTGTAIAVLILVEAYVLRPLRESERLAQERTGDLRVEVGVWSESYIELAAACKFAGVDLEKILADWRGLTRERRDSLLVAWHWKTPGAEEAPPLMEKHPPEEVENWFKR